MGLIDRAKQMSNWWLGAAVFAMLLNVAAMTLILMTTDSPGMRVVAWLLLIFAGALAVFYLTIFLCRQRGRARATDEH